MDGSERDSIVLTASDTVGKPFTEVFAYWLSKRGDAWAPRLSDFRLDDLPPRVVPWSVLVDVGDREGDFLYRFWGTERRNLIGYELTGKSLSDIPDAFMRNGNVREYKHVVATRMPLLCQTPVTTSTGREAVFETMRLPLSQNGVSVTHIYSLVNFLELRRGHYELFGTESRSAE